jgi:hypothetical protein
MSLLWSNRLASFIFLMYAHSLTQSREETKNQVHEKNYTSIPLDCHARSARFWECGQGMQLF